MKRTYPFILLLVLVSIQPLFSQTSTSCEQLSENINLGGAAHDLGFQENDPVNTVAMLSNGNFVVAWETRNDVDGAGSGGFFRVFKADGTPLTGPSTPYADINATGVGNQGVSGPKVVALSAGFVIGWESEDGPGDTGAAGDDQQDVFIRVYNNDGSPLAGSTRISIADEEDQLAAILPLSSGGFVVLTRIDEDNTGNNDDFFFQAFNAAGTVLSGGLVNVSGGLHDASFQSTDISQPMTDLGNGTFAVAWEARDNADGEGNGGFFRIFNTNGTPVTGVIMPYADINPAGTGDQGTPGPRLIALANGNLVVSWDSEQGPGDLGPGNTDDQDVYFRVYGANGTPLTGTTKANSDNTAEEEILRGLIALNGGNFAILYNTDDDEIGNTDDYYVRAFTPAGIAAGNSIEVSGGAHLNFYCTMQPDNLGFIALNNGNFAVGWVARDGADGDGTGIYYRVFNATGAAVSPVTLPYVDINAAGTGNQSSGGPILATLPDGFAIGWQSEQGPGDVGPGNDDNQDVYHRVIGNDGNPLCGTTKTNLGNEAEEEILEAVHPLANGDFVVIYKDDEDETGNLDDYFARVIGGAPLTLVCPTIGEITVTPACEGESYTITVTGLENMAKADNNERDYGITFHGVLSADDIYSNPGFAVIGTVPFSALTNGGTTATFSPTIIDNLNLLIVARLDAVPSDGSCRPQVSVNRVIEYSPFIQIGAPQNYCVDAGVQMGLGSVSPTGGIFSGPGITDGGNGMTYSLDPTAAGVGIHQLTYTLSTALCGLTPKTEDFEIFATPTVAFAAPADLDEDAGVQMGLGGGTPAQGSAAGDLGMYAGPGVTDGGNGMTYSFDPATAGVGVHTITYTYTDANGCTAMASDEVEVLSAALVITPIDDINDLNADGVGISVGQEVAIQGVVHCIDFLEGTEIQFYVLEPNGDGIGVYAAQTLNDYMVMEGDKVIIEGKVSQYNGSLEIDPTNITLVSQNNELVSPIATNTLAEPIENKLVTLEVTDVDSESIQLSTFDGGFFIRFPSPSHGDLGVRVWNNTGLSSEFLVNYISQTNISAYRITGIVVQEDAESPFDDSYSLYPCSEESFDVMVATHEPAWATALLLFPNPTKDRLQVKAPVQIESFFLRDLQGKVLQGSEIHDQQYSLDLRLLPQGVYHLQLISGGTIVNRMVIRQ